MARYQSLYRFKNFTDLTEQESEEILQGRNDPEVRRWMTNDQLISIEDHDRFMSSLKGDLSKVYIRIERSERFVGIYSLNDLAAGSGQGGFWVTHHARDRLLSLNVVFQGMDYMFRTLNIQRIYGWQKSDNFSTIRLNALLGLTPNRLGCDCRSGMQKIEITKEQWQLKTAQNNKLIKLMNRTEMLNGTP